MGMPRGHSLSIYATFRAKREPHCIFLGKKAFIITSKQGLTIFFFAITIFFWENLKKNWPQKRAYVYWASISNRAYAPWATHNTP